jgi:hypothetical protein
MHTILYVKKCSKTTLQSASEALGHRTQGEEYSLNKQHARGTLAIFINIFEHSNVITRASSASLASKSLQLSATGDYK